MVLDSPRYRGVAEFQDAIDFVPVEPPARDAGTDVRFVLVIRVDHLDRTAPIGRGELLNGLLDADEGGRAAATAEGSGLVAQHA